MIAGSIAYVGDKIIASKAANKPASGKNVNKKMNVGGSLDSVNASPQFENIPAPSIPDSTDAAFNALIEKTGQNAPSSIGTTIKSAQDVVQLDNIVVTARFAADGRFINTIPKFSVNRAEILVGFMSQGVSSLLIARWRQEFETHAVNNTFGDLDAFGQNIADNNIAKQLLDIEKDLIQYEATNQWYATTSFNISMATIAPLALAEGSVAAGLGLTKRGLSVASKTIGLVRKTLLLPLRLTPNSIKLKFLLSLSCSFVTPFSDVTFAYLQHITQIEIKMVIKRTIETTIKLISK